MLPFFVVLNYKVSTLVKGNSNKTTMVCWQGKTTGNEKGGNAMYIKKLSVSDSVVPSLVFRWYGFPQA